MMFKNGVIKNTVSANYHKCLNEMLHVQQKLFYCHLQYMIKIKLQLSPLDQIVQLALITNKHMQHLSAAAQLFKYRLLFFLFK